MAADDEGGFNSNMTSTQAQVVRDFAALLSFAINIDEESGGVGGGKINFPLREASQSLPFKIDSSVVQQDSAICCRVPSLELQQRDCVFFPSSSISLLEDAAASNLRQSMDISKNELVDLPMKLLWNLSKSLQSMVDSRLRFSLAALLKQEKQQQQTQNTSSSSNNNGTTTTTATTGSSVSLLSRMVLETLKSAYSAGTISPSTVVTTFRTLAFSERTQDGEHVVPLVVEVVVDFSVLGKTVTVHMEAPGTIQGRFSCPSSLFDCNNNNKTTSLYTAEPPGALLVFAEVVIDTSALLQSMMTQAKTVVSHAVATATDLAMTLMQQQQQLDGVSSSFQHQFNAAAALPSSDMMNFSFANDITGLNNNNNNNNSLKCLAASLMSSSPDSANAIFAAACVAAIGRNNNDNSASQQTRRSIQQQEASYSVTPTPTPPTPPPPSRSAAHTTTASVSGTTALRDFLAAAARAAAQVAVSPSAPQAAAPTQRNSMSASLPPPSNTSDTGNNNSSAGWDASQPFTELVAKVLQGKQRIQNVDVPTTMTDTVTHNDNNNNGSNPAAQPHLNSLRWNELKNGPFAALFNTDAAGTSTTSTTATQPSQRPKTQGDERKPPAVTTDTTSSENSRNCSSDALLTVITGGGGDGGGGGGLIADRSVGRLNPLSLSSGKATTSQSSLQQQQQQSTLGAAAAAATSSTNASTSWAQNFRDSPSINGLNLLSAALTSLKRHGDDEDQHQDEMKQEPSKSTSADNLKKRALDNNNDNGLMAMVKTTTSSSSVNTSSTASSHGGGTDKRLKRTPEG